MNKYIIDNWKQLPKMLSAWVAFACITYSELLSEAQQIAVLKLLGIPEDRVLGVVGTLFLVSRALKQFRPASVAAPSPAGEAAYRAADPTQPKDQ